MEGGTPGRFVARTAVVFVILGTFLATAPAAAACSGTALAGQDMTDPDAAVIFTGTAVRREDPGPLRLGNNLSDPVRWTFVVDGVEKGSAARRMTIESERADGACGVVFQLGHRYRVVVADKGHGMQVWANSGTSLLESLAAPPPVEGDGIGANPWLAGLFGAAALFAVLAFVRRQRSIRAF